MALFYITVLFSWETFLFVFVRTRSDIVPLFCSIVEQFYFLGIQFLFAFLVLEVLHFALYYST